MSNVMLTLKTAGSNKLFALQYLAFRIIAGQAEQLPTSPREAVAHGVGRPDASAPVGANGPTALAFRALTGILVGIPFFGPFLVNLFGF